MAVATVPIALASGAAFIAQSVAPAPRVTAECAQIYGEGSFAMNCSSSELPDNGLPATGAQVVAPGTDWTEGAKGPDFNIYGGQPGCEKPYDTSGCADAPQAPDFGSVTEADGALH